MVHEPEAFPELAHRQTDAHRKGGRRRARGHLSVAEMVESLRHDPELGPCFEHWHEQAARVARYGELLQKPSEQEGVVASELLLPKPALPRELLPELEEAPQAAAENSAQAPTQRCLAGLDPRLHRLLVERGQARPFSHQARAVELALAGHDVIVSTPTASGKTFCYTVPILQRLLETNGASKALCLFPTKALSQDQSAGLTTLFEGLKQEWHAATYDGDTPPSVRRTLRERGHVILTNPWMLHAGILPNHAKWSELFRDLRTIVIDEVHTLAGVFGSNVANVLRRLVRIARHYGADPRFVLSSATLQDPKAHAERLLGRPVEVVDEDGSPTGKRVFGVYNPPMINPVAGLRANALEQARLLATRVCGPAHQTIFFCNRRTAVEVLTRYLKETAGEMGLRPEEIRGYRGGYLPNLRREIESGLRSGQVRVVVTTNALELGIDIGKLDVAVLVGYPGSQASFWQRAGRVGRRGDTSLVIQISRSDPLDQFLVAHPSFLFGAARERTGLNPDNLVVLSEQVKCAAFELPFRSEALQEGPMADPGFGKADHVEDILDFLAEESGILHKKQDTWYWMADAYPAEDVSLGGNDPDNVEIIDQETRKAIGEIDREGSITSVHEGAIYLVEGETWIVERFDYENRRAYVRRVETDYFTEAATETEVRVLRLERRSQRLRSEAPVRNPMEGAQLVSGSKGPSNTAGGGAEETDCIVLLGEVHVKTLATNYKKVRYYTRENLGNEDIHLPPEELDTNAVIFQMSERTAAELGLAGGDRGAAWSGLGNLLRRVAPLYLRCQPADLGLSAQVRSAHFLKPTLFLYERVQGGVGLSEPLFDTHLDLLRAALDVVLRCACLQGCPACVGPLAEVGPHGKDTARRILTHWVENPALLEVEDGTGTPEDMLGDPNIGPANAGEPG